MMEELARVVKVDSSGWVTVEVEVKTACGSCSASENCGAGSIATAFSGKTQRFSIHSSEQCEEGELLRLGLPESSILKAAALVYLLPLAGLLIGALVGKLLGSVLSVSVGADSGVGVSGGLAVGLAVESSSVLFAVVGALCCWLAGKKLARKLERDATPVVLARLGKALAPDCFSKPA